MANLKMPEMNHIVLAGRATRDPELRHTTSGSAVLSISTAVNRRVKKGDEWGDEVMFLDVVVWKEQAEKLAAKIKKGTPFIAEGRLEITPYETKSGEKRTQVKMQAQRVQTLEWDTEKGETAKGTLEKSASEIEEVNF